MNEWDVVLGVLVIVAGAVVLKRIATLERKLDASSRLEGKLDVLLGHFGLQFDPYRDVPTNVVAAIDRGEKIEAIKEYRAATGAGLKEAKEFVEEVQRRKKI